MKRVAKKVPARRRAMTHEQLARQREWYKESRRAISDQLIAMERASYAPRVYLVRAERIRRTA